MKAEDINRFIKNVKHAVNTTPKLLSYKEDIKTLCAMLKDWARGEYKHISKRTMAIAGACILYIVSPIDFIPAFIPVLGKTDDAAVIVFLLKTLKKEIGFYRIWVATRENDIIDVD